MPEAVINFLALLGWTPSHTHSSQGQILTLDELSRLFSLSAIGRSLLTVDEDKLRWINKQHFARKLEGGASRRELVARLRDCLDEAGVRFARGSFSHSLRNYVD